MKYRYLIVFVCFVASGTAIVVHDCGSKAGVFSGVTVANCEPDAPVCILWRGSNTSIDFDFTPNVDVTTVTAVVHGVIGGVAIPYQIANPDACVDSGITCPLKAGTKVHYSGLIPVLKSYPTLSVKVRWEMQSEAGEDVVCMEIKTKIK